jgi:hypothetical protein
MLCKHDKYIKPSICHYATGARSACTSKALFANGRRMNSWAQKLASQSTDALSEWLGLVFTLFRHRPVSAVQTAHMHIVIATHVNQLDRLNQLPT